MRRNSFVEEQKVHSFVVAINYNLIIFFKIKTQLTKRKTKIQITVTFNIVQLKLRIYLHFFIMFIYTFISFGCNVFRFFNHV